MCNDHVNKLPPAHWLILLNPDNREMSRVQAHSEYSFLLHILHRCR